MNAAADELERVMREVGCTVDPNAQYRADYNTAQQSEVEDDAMDADFEEM